MPIDQRTAIKLRTADDAGETSVVAIAGDNEQVDGLADRKGRIWTKVALGNEAVSGTNPLPVTVTAGSSDILWEYKPLSNTNNIGPAAAVTLFYFFGHYAATTQAFLQIFNAVAQPADTTIPDFELLLPPASATAWTPFSLAIPSNARDLPAGLWYSVSSTAGSLTLLAGTDLYVNAGYL